MQFVNNYNKKYYLRELADLLKKPHQTIKPYVEKLVKEGILIKNQRKNIVEYGINFKSKQIYDYLVIAGTGNMSDIEMQKKIVAAQLKLKELKLHLMIMFIHLIIKLLRVKSKKEKFMKNRTLIK